MHYLRFLFGAAGVLVALLFVANAVLPQPEAAPPERDFDHSIIRINSTAKLPDRMVADTTMHAPVAPTPVAAAVEPAPSAPHREALAQMSAEETGRAAQPAAQPEKIAQRRHSHRHVAARLAGQRDRIARSEGPPSAPPRTLFAGIFSPFGIH